MSKKVHHTARPTAAPPVPPRGSVRTPGWRWLAVGALAVLIAGGAWLLLRQPSAVDPRRTVEQNVLLITIDTLRADALGSMGGGAATPNLDRLAALGASYDSAHAHAVITLPSHTSILTGLYPYQHGIRDNAGFRVPDSTPSIATILRARGFATAAFVGSFALDSRFGLDHGFDVYDERYGKSDTTSGFRMAERRADAVVSAATAWIGRQKGRWFAWVHVFDPHAPYDPPAPFSRTYADRLYLGEVAFTDAALGPLLDAARDGSGRPTLVIATGDHGEALGDHGEATHGLFAYESTLRIPLIMAQLDRDTPAWNAGEPPRRPGLRSHVEARHVDILPTVLDALGLPPAASVPGRTLLPWRVEEREGRVSYFEALSSMLNRGWAPLTGVLQEGRKFIDLPLPELYHLSADPGETTNLVNRDTAQRLVLEARLKAFGADTRVDRAAEDPEARARLQALGYVSGNAPVKARYSERDDPKTLLPLDQLLHQAVDLYERKRPLEAMAVYAQVLAKRPDMEITYAQLAMLQWELGRPADAVATLRKAVEVGAGSTAVQTKLGIYLAESGQVQEAIPLLQHATAGDATDLDALNALGIALGRAGRNGEALAAFQRILRLNPSNTMALENVGSIAAAEGRLEDARKAFGAALASDPTSAQAHNGLGVVEFRLGNRPAAIDHWRQSVVRDPSNFDALYNLATELVNDGRPAEARPYLEQFARTAPPAFYARDIARVRGLLARLPQ